MGFAADISAQVRQDTGFHMAYPPGVPLRLGDVVVRDAGIWVPVANLYDDLDLPAETVDDSTPDDWQASSERGFDLDVKVAGEPSGVFKFLTEAEAGVKVRLTGESAFVLGLAGARFQRMKSVDAFWDAFKDRRSRWHWDLARRIVTRVVHADSATFLASASGESSFELKAEADLAAGGVKVANLAAGFTLRSTMAAKDQFVAKSGLTPLFSAHRMRLLGDLGPAEAAAATVGQMGIEKDPEA